MKKACISFLVILSVMLSCITVSASNITVTLNGAVLSFDVSPQIISDRTFVPMRKIFESLGATVSWDDATKTITGRKNGTIVNLSIGSDVLIKNGVPKKLDVAPTIVDSRTLVPVRAIAESFDCDVEWIAEANTVKITTDSGTIREPLSAAQIYEKMSPSVFYVEVYDENSEAIASGSGFFISSDGVAVTNYHVIEDTYSAKITTVSGKIYPVINIISYDKDLDVAIIRISKTAEDGSSVYGFPALALADSDKIITGQTVYAIGSPVGLQSTISDGIISNTNRNIDGNSFMQTTAAISPGSSGGVLADEYGEALGITSAGITDAENIGFAIPINIIKPFDLTSEGITYSEFASNNDTEFILELHMDTVELNVGESTTVYVYAEGKGDDWSIYWDTEQEDVVSCEWGDWEDDNVCPLKITAVGKGVAKVTVYSDVDFKGKDIFVYVENSEIGIYPSSMTSVPTYTSVTGVELINIYQGDEYTTYEYDFTDLDDVIRYAEFLDNLGFTEYDSDEDEYSFTVYCLTPESHIISLSVVYEWNEVWITIPN